MEQVAAREVIRSGNTLAAHLLTLLPISVRSQCMFDLCLHSRLVFLLKSSVPSLDRSDVSTHCHRKKRRNLFELRSCQEPQTHSQWRSRDY